MVLLKSFQDPLSMTKTIIEAANSPISQDILIVFSDQKVKYSSAVLVVVRYINKDLKVKHYK